MATYQFVVQLPPARSGGTPACDKWTFHHVLPWKYFFCLSGILSYYYYSSLNAYMRGPNIKSTPELLGELHDPVARFAGVVTCSDTINFSVGASWRSFVDMGRLIDGMARTPAGILDKIARIRAAGAAAPILVECTSPYFGGFPGMDGNQRSDDPKSSMEQTRPRNGDVAWWNALIQIGNTLERASLFEKKDKSGCKDLKSSVYGDKIRFKLSNDDLDNLLLGNLRMLVTPHHNTDVLPFDEKAWAVQYGGAKRPMKVDSDSFAYPSLDKAIASYSFSVSSIDAHLLANTSNSNFLTFTRCPGIDNEMNILRPTAESAKKMTFK